jgi:hypothetical protein
MSLTGFVNEDSGGQAGSGDVIGIIADETDSCDCKNRDSGVSESSEFGAKSHRMENCEEV